MIEVSVAGETLAVEAVRLGVSLVLLATVVWIAHRFGVRLDRRVAVAASRALVQLLILGSIILAVFEIDSLALNSAILGIMVLVGAWTAAEYSPLARSFPIALVTLASVSALLIAPLTVLEIIEQRSEFFLPFSAMIVGNAMNAASLAYERLDREIRTAREKIETLLALGLDARFASRHALSASIEASLIPSLNRMKTIGLVHIPGLMTGLLIAGADPLFAAQLQAVIIFLIFTADVLTSILVSWVSRDDYFTEEERFDPRYAVEGERS